MSAVVIQTLSADRFDTYLKAAGHDVDRALALYLWNARLGAAFHLPIQAVEVALRNSANMALTAQFGVNWWQMLAFSRLLGPEGTADIDMVKRRVQRKGLALVTAQIVAGLSFGFWVSLLSPSFNPGLWSYQLRAAFPNLPATENRGSLFKASGDIANLRNRISHHEPIFQRDLQLDFSELMKLLSWICPTTEAWIRPHCEISAVVRQKP
jgi:hypothetical protein